MAVTLTVSKTLGGSGVADTLAGGGTGIDLGSVLNGEYTPVVSKAANTGWQNIYVRHNATVDPITEVKTFIAGFSQAYGGAGSPTNDLNTLTAKGQSSSSSPNNGDGLGSGLRIEMDADIAGALGASAFDATRAQVKIYGDNGTDGISLASAFNLHADACVRNNAGSPVDATAPQTGKIGKSGDTALGDAASLKLRYYLEESGSVVSGRPEGGIIMWDWVIAYSFTA